MATPSPMQRFLTAQVEMIGWAELLRRAAGAFTSGALQGWLRGAIPGPSNQEVLARITSTKLATIKDLAWESERQKEMTEALPAPRKRVGQGIGAPRRRRALGGLGAIVTAVLAFTTGSGTADAMPQPADLSDHTFPLIGHSDLNRWWRRWFRPQPVVC